MWLKGSHSLSIQLLVLNIDTVTASLRLISRLYAPQIPWAQHCKALLCFLRAMRLSERTKHQVFVTVSASDIS